MGVHLLGSVKFRGKFRVWVKIHGLHVMPHRNAPGNQFKGINGKVYFCHFPGDIS